jgi:hypothetical protein
MASEEWGEGSVGDAAQAAPKVAPKAIPIHKPGTPEYESAVNGMADNIVSSYVASVQDRSNSLLGEKFYSHDAHGAAHAISRGRDPDSPVGKLYRRAPLGAKTAGYEQVHPDLNVAKHSPEQLPGIHRAAGVLARLSPQTGWGMNIRQAHQAYQMDPDGPTMQNLRAHAAGETKFRDPIPGDLNNHPTVNVIKAVDLAHGRGEVGDYVRHEGKNVVKIGSFYNNIVNPSTSERTTVDFRHHDIARGQLQDTSDDRGLSARGRYSMYEEATNRATARINADYPDMREQAEPLRPHQIQAVAWWGDKRDVDARMADYPGATRSIDSKTNIFRIPNENGRGSRSLSRSDLGKPIGQD